MAATGKRFKAERIVNLLRQIKVLVDQWARHYNTRPHSLLGYKPPAPEAIINMPMQTLHSVMH
jgi:transposase InsO family protein